MSALTRFINTAILRRRARKLFKELEKLADDIDAANKAHAIDVDEELEAIVKADFREERIEMIEEAAPIFLRLDSNGNISTWGRRKDKKQ